MTPNKQNINLKQGREMSDQIILKSVGSYVDTNGHVGPLDKDGYPDMYEGTSVDVLDVDDEWVDQLSEEDCRSFLSVVLYRNKPLSASAE